MVTVKYKDGKELESILVSAQFKMWFCGLLLAGIVGFNTAGGMDVSLL